MLENCMFTSESVTQGHPDKMADQISDAILDALLAVDPKSRVACETLVNTGVAFIAGEITTKANINYQNVVRNKILDIGYDDSAKGFDGKSCAVLVSLDSQSADIAQGVNEGEGTFKEMGAGDQGIMFGYATDETANFMPFTIDMSHQLAQRLETVRKEKILPFILPDGKTQVSVQYENGKITRIGAIVVSTQHTDNVSLATIQEGVREEVIKKIIPQELIDCNTNIYINPTGRFVIGGPQGDCGLTGRKIIVDTYGGHGAHGGGAFSGKDPSKVDRSAAYAARQVAKHIVAANLAKKALVQVAYAIGVDRPVSFMVETYGTNTVPVERINKAINEIFDMRPKAIIDRLKLLAPIYSATATYGHFGRNAQVVNGHELFSWEKLSYLEQLKSHF